MTAMTCSIDQTKPFVCFTQCQAKHARRSGPSFPLKAFHNDIKRQLLNRCVKMLEHWLSNAALLQHAAAPMLTRQPPTHQHATSCLPVIALVIWSLQRCLSVRDRLYKTSHAPCACTCAWPPRWCAALCADLLEAKIVCWISAVGGGETLTNGLMLRQGISLLLA